MKKIVEFKFNLIRNGDNRGNYSCFSLPIVGKRFEYVDDEYWYLTSPVTEITKDTDSEVSFIVSSGSTYTLK